MNRLMQFGRVFVKRFPYIVGYTLLSFILFGVLREGYRWVAPGSWYLGYDSYEVQSVPEGENIPYTACRNSFGNYEIRGGSRTVFKIVDVKNPNNETLFDVIPFPEGTSTTNRRCVDSFIDVIKGEDVLDLPPGNYRVTHVVKFKIDSILPWVEDGYDKKSETRSNIFNISEKVLSPEDIRMRIEELERELELLKQQLITVEAVVPSPTASNQPAQQQRQSVTNNTTTNTTNNTTNTNNQSNNQQQTEPVRILGVPVCVPLVGCVEQ